MNKYSAKYIIFALALAAMAACGKETTHYVPMINSSTGAATPAAGTALPASQNGTNQDGGGVIVGGGGKGIRCNKNGKSTVEVLDLYEARTLYNLKLVSFGNTESAAKEKLAEVLARHLKPAVISGKENFESYKNRISDEMIKNIYDHFNFSSSAQQLKLVNDSHEPMIEDGCEAVQIAYYYDESTLLVNKNLWEQLDPTNKMALVAHESLYYLVRQIGVKNSIGVRKLVGHLFSTKGIRPIFDQVPEQFDTKAISCYLSSNGFDRGNMWIYPSLDKNQMAGIEVVFQNLDGDDGLFRVSTFFNDLAVSQILNPEFQSKSYGSLIKDSYPARDGIRINFKGIKDGQLNAELRLLKAGATNENSIFTVRCNIKNAQIKNPYAPLKPAIYEYLASSEKKKITLEIKEDGKVISNRMLNGCEVNEVSELSGFDQNDIVSIILSYEPASKSVTPKCQKEIEKMNLTLKESLHISETHFSDLNQVK